jgi:hypothetical protein
MKINLLFITILFLFSCDNFSENENLHSEKDYKSYETKKEDSDFRNKGSFKAIGNGKFKISNQINFHNRKMIWNGDIKFQVENVTNSTNNISEIVTEKGGFVSNLNLTSTNYKISNNITIRIENSKFHELINSLKGESIFLEKEEITSNDVTAEFVDIESRLKTKKEVRNRYITILKTKTGKVKDIIAAEEAIRKITEEIEAKEGRLRYLKDKVNFSTVKLNIYQKVDYKAEPTVFEKPYLSKMGKSFQNGWDFIKGLFLVLVSIWPLLLVLGGFIFWKRKWLFGKKK